MFDTEGIVDKELLKALGKYIVPDIQRGLFKLVSVILLIGGIVCMPLEQFKMAAVLLTSSVLFFIAAFFYQFIMQWFFVRWNLKILSEYTDLVCGSIRTFYDAEGIHVSNSLTVAATLPYNRFKKLVETKKYYFLLTKMQFVVTMKEGLNEDERKQFILYIKEQCPQIKVIRKT